jgi:hypothetical protein
MSDKTVDSRARYLEEVCGLVDRHRQRAFEYEREAIAFAMNGFRVLTYLNGGGLLTIPTAVTLFKTDIQQVKVPLIVAALCFVGSLILVIVTHTAAFFTMAKRSESEQLREHQQLVFINANNLTEIDEVKRSLLVGMDLQKVADKKVDLSNGCRMIGICFFWSALLIFIGGCGFGAWAILS